jgi:catechol 2,3-dioxygenase-like lactoylglutathione lyase family enzyme
VPIVRIVDIAYVRFTAPELQIMRSFLEDFGLSEARASEQSLYMRGHGDSPFLHATEHGDPGFAAVGFKAESRADLESLAQSEGVEVEQSPYPGGGVLVRLSDPDGMRVEVIASQEPARPHAIDTLPDINSAAGKPRKRKTVRTAQGPARIVRLGHIVLNVSDFRRSEEWYKSRFGFITSDEIEMAPGFAIGAFMRCDRGAEPTDHHTLFLLQAPQGPGFNHAAFEVADVNDVMAGHAHLKVKGHDQSWGVGRHILGSQIFDYWKDPWGHELEHWTDGDLFVADDPSGKATIAELLQTQWGPAHPMLAAMQGGN